MLNKMGKKLGHKDGGFTIIEVLIVLAIAGLILAIVLIAIPQLQRNQRNQARRDVVNRIKTEIDAYAGNNNGQIPADAADLNSVYTRYLDCSGTAAAPTADSCGVDINGPSTGLPMPTSIPGTELQGGELAPATSEDAISYNAEYSCDGENLTSESGSRRVYAMWTTLEGGATYCVDNR